MTDLNVAMSNFPEADFSPEAFVAGLMTFVGVIFVLMIWSIVWKGIALWKSARNGDKIWFIALLVVNTVGILEILYIVLFSKKKSKQTDSTQSANQPLGDKVPES